MWVSACAARHQANRLLSVRNQGAKRDVRKTGPDLSQNPSHTPTMIVRTALAACLVASAGELYLLCSRHWLRLGHLGKEEEGWGGAGAGQSERTAAAGAPALPTDFGTGGRRRRTSTPASAWAAAPWVGEGAAAEVGSGSGRLAFSGNGEREGLGSIPSAAACARPFGFPRTPLAGSSLLFRWRDSAASPLLPLPSDDVSRNIHVLKRTAGPPPRGDRCRNPIPYSWLMEGRGGGGGGGGGGDGGGAGMLEAPVGTHASRLGRSRRLGLPLHGCCLLFLFPCPSPSPSSRRSPPPPVRIPLSLSLSISPPRSSPKTQQPPSPPPSSPAPPPSAPGPPPRPSP